MKRTPLFLGAAVLGIIALVAVIMLMSGDEENDGGENATAEVTETAVASGQLSDNGLYRAQFVSELEPVPVNQMHTWTLQVTTADGEPVENAVITIDGLMPDHGHGLPTQPEVTEYLGEGQYRVEGMRFNMPGYWLVNVHLPDDIVTFELTLQ